MYIEHSSFIQPKNKDIKLWRYLDFTKFVSMLSSSSLYLTRVDKFDDPFEGSLPLKDYMKREHCVEQIFDECDSFETIEQLKQQHREDGKADKCHVYANCWHMNTHESFAMWNLYLKSNEGISIQSTFSKLQKSVTSDKFVYGGIVKYIDYNNDSLGCHDLFTKHLHKRLGFKHEQEFRIMSPRTECDDKSQKNGINVQVDLNKLIENIYISPTAPSWFNRLVQEIIAKYDYNFNVIKSDLSRTPVF